MDVHRLHLGIGRRTEIVARSVREFAAPADLAGEFRDEEAVVVAVDGVVGGLRTPPPRRDLLLVVRVRSEFVDRVEVDATDGLGVRRSRVADVRTKRS